MDRISADTEVIALLLPEPAARRQAGAVDSSLPGAQTLIRGADGRMSLEDIQSEEEFDRLARTTGCFQRGKPIRDPKTREVIGYELEEVPVLSAAAG